MHKSGRPAADYGQGCVSGSQMLKRLSTRKQEWPPLRAKRPCQRPFSVQNLLDNGHFLMPFGLRLWPPPIFLSKQGRNTLS